MCSMCVFTSPHMHPACFVKLALYQCNRSYNQFSGFCTECLTPVCHFSLWVYDNIIGSVFIDFFKSLFLKAALGFSQEMTQIFSFSLVFDQIRCFGLTNIFEMMTDI